jgi:hypothetical protein
MVFMLNPCHMISVLLIYICFNDFSPSTEKAAIWMFSQAYGAWLGLLITENDGLPKTEVFFYYSEHLLCSFLGPLILSLNNRFDVTKYANPRFVLGGYLYFCFY